MTIVRSSTIYDVAERAQVSIATVSRVLNSPEQVNSQTRQRVQAAINDLSFVPRAEASARARRSASRIGVLAPFFTYPSFVERLQGVAEALSGAQYELAIYNVDSVDRRDLFLSHLPITRRLDGLIIMALPFNPSYVDLFQNHNLEAVLIECEHPSLSSINIDDEAGGRLVAEFFVAQGHRNCGFIGDSIVPDYAIHKSNHRLHGYKQGLADAGLQLAEHAIGLDVNGMEPARQQALAILSRPDRPTAIFSPSDTQAIGVLRAARDLGIQVPGELAIVGFDDIEAADYIGLTTVRQPLNESGRIAVDLLLSCFQQERSIQHIGLSLTLVRRETA